MNFSSCLSDADSEEPCPAAGCHRDWARPARECPQARPSTVPSYSELGERPSLPLVIKKALFLLYVTVGVAGLIRPFCSNQRKPGVPESLKGWKGPNSECPGPGVVHGGSSTHGQRALIDRGTFRINPVFQMSLSLKLGKQPGVKHVKGKRAIVTSSRKGTNSSVGWFV